MKIRLKCWNFGMVGRTLCLDLQFCFLVKFSVDSSFL